MSPATNFAELRFPLSFAYFLAYEVFDINIMVFIKSEMLSSEIEIDPFIKSMMIPNQESV